MGNQSEWEEELFLVVVVVLLWTKEATHRVDANKRNVLERFLELSFKLCFFGNERRPIVMMCKYLHMIFLNRNHSIYGK